MIEIYTYLYWLPAIALILMSACGGGSEQATPPAPVPPPVSIVFEHEGLNGSVVLDPQNANIIYTAGWDKEFDIPQPLILEISRNRGTTWEQHQLDDPNLFGGVSSILATQENNRSVLYLGLHRGGIFRVPL
ncbi:MAG: hypothetical protein KJO35_08285 [Gammaproteobacteria bacterium]|nr:hypothetical protein [Gammaproteobacteria bacterium]